MEGVYRKVAMIVCYALVVVEKLRLIGKGLDLDSDAVRAHNIRVRALIL